MKTQKRLLLRPTDLNYHHYRKDEYDQDIVAVIPFHSEIHAEILRELKQRFSKDDPLRVLELGVGTGLTTAIIKSVFPNAEFDVIDFSTTMLAKAKKRLGKKGMTYHLGDFAKIPFVGSYDVVIAVIGIHHQTHSGKRRLFKKIVKHLKPGGIFLFGDLMTCKDDKIAAEKNARHYHYLVENARTSSALRDWAHHHMFLNNLATIEEQEKWLRDVGCQVKRLFYKWNTALLLSIKNK